MALSQMLKAPLRYVAATALAGISGGLSGSLPSLSSIGSPSAPPGAWPDQIIGLTILTVSVAIVTVLPLCLVVRWIMWRRRLRGPIAAMIAGVVMAVATAVALIAASSSILVLTPRQEWSDFLPSFLCLVGFALTWPVFLDRLDPAVSRSPNTPGVEGDGIRDVDRVVRVATETLTAAVALVPVLLVGFFGSFAVGLGTGEDWHVVETFRSASGLNRAYVVYRSWGGAVGGIDSQVYVLPAATEWNERDRGLLLWSGDHIDSVRVVWDSDRALRVQARAQEGISLAEYSQGWSRSGFNVRTEPLP